MKENWPVLLIGVIAITPIVFVAVVQSTTIREYRWHFAGACAVLIVILGDIDAIRYRRNKRP